MPKPPGLPLAWIKTHFNEIFEQWQKQAGTVTNQANDRWDNHPQKEEWLNKIRATGPASFILENGSLDKERQKFTQWAEATNAIWGMES